MAQLPDFSRLHVLVVGDVMIDRYVYGRVDRMSPEAPVPVVRKLGTEDRLGGAGNVALNLRALGAGAGIAGAIGAGNNGNDLLRLLADNGIGGRLLIRDPDRTTTVKTRIVSQKRQLLRIDSETTDELSADHGQLLLRGIADLLATDRIDLVIMQDYNKGVLNPAVIKEVIEVASKGGAMIAVDPKAGNFWSYRGVDLFKPNLREIQAQLDFTITASLADLDRAAAVMFDRLGCREVMITLSEHGIYTNDGRRSAIAPIAPRGIIDVSGAGDTVISVAAAARATGMELVSTARLANLAGAQVISRSGVVAVDLTGLKRDWESSTHTHGRVR